MLNWINNLCGKPTSWRNAAKKSCYRSPSIHSRNVGIALIVGATLGVIILLLAKYGLIHSGLRAISPHFAHTLNHAWQSLSENAHHGIQIGSITLISLMCLSGGILIHRYRMHKLEDKKKFSDWHDQTNGSDT